ncbi:MAG: hypothetical protein ACI4GW_06785 [Lachnospiraceae bacterium]
MDAKEKKLTILAVLYIILVYAAPIAFFLVLELTSENANALILGFFFVPVVLSVINLIYVKCNYNDISRTALLKCTLLIKYLLIPMYIVGGMLNVLLFFLIFTPVVFMVFVSPVIIGILCFFGWIYMIGGGIFSLAYIIKAAKEGVHGKFLSVIAGVLQFFFTVDVLSMMILSIKEKKYIPATISLVLIMVLGCIGSVLWLVTQVIFGA